MPRYLLTPSLHDSWRWYNLLVSKEKKDFLDTLQKKPITDPKALENISAGIKLEDDVEDYLQGRGVWPMGQVPPYIREIGEHVRGGLNQERVMFDVNYFGVDFLVYGKADRVKRDWVYDLKRSGSYDLGKYTESIQHTVYMVGTGLKKFKYLITDEENVWVEDYYLSDDMVTDMHARLQEMADGIFADREFKEAYFANWEADKPRKPPLTDQQINVAFDAVKQKNIAQLKRDMRHD